MMDGPEEFQFDQLIGTTDRGTLWRAGSGGYSGRIVRLIEPRFCDRQFRQSLARLRERQHPSMLRIVGEGWHGVHFYVEYLADSPWETLQAHFGCLHWRMRLPVVRQICAALPEWSTCPVHPLGLNGHNILMLKDAGRWFPWLLPCPALQYTSPCDLFGCDVISTLAPEIVRGVSFDHRAEDSYALGVLAVHALGGKEPQEASTDEERVEAQACGSQLTCDVQASAVEPFLHGIEPVRELFHTVCRYVEISPVARPISAADLQRACDAAFAATDPLSLATELVNRTNSREALRMLDWGFRTFGETLQGHLLAADLCEKIEDLPQALQHLERAIQLAPGDFDLRARRCELRWLHFTALPPLGPGEPDPEGDLLLEDLAILKALPGRLSRKTLPYLKAAAVYRRRQDLIMASQELYRAADLEPSDMLALFLYGQCLKDLQDSESTLALVRQARHRLDRMVKSEMMQEAEANIWRDKFDALLHC